MRRILLGVGLATGMVLAQPTAAWACAGLLGENGSIQLLRTSTLAAYHDGVEHYVTSFEFAGGGAELGSIIPLPGVPTKVEKGGAWTLQRLAQETRSGDDSTALLATAGEAFSYADARVILETRIDALEITILEGGGDAVGDWALEHGFLLTPDAPEMLDFYAERSPIFMAARFDASAARQQGDQVGDGTPVHLTIPTDDPWVPLRILGLGREAGDRVEADVFLLTDREPALLGGVGDELSLDVSRPASDLLLADLRSDEGMDWMPDDLWLSYLRVDAPAGSLDFDLAVDASGAGRPSSVDAGLIAFTGGLERFITDGDGEGGGWPVAAVAFLTTIAVVVAAAVVAAGRERAPGRA